VSGIYPFMWCLDYLAKCDDSANPKDEFYSIGGDTLQLSGPSFPIAVIRPFSTDTLRAARTWAPSKTRTFRNISAPGCT